MRAGTDPPETVLRNLVDAFENADQCAMGDLLDEHVVANITNAPGGTERIDGRATLLGRIGEVEYGGGAAGRERRVLAPILVTPALTRGHARPAVATVQS